MYPKYHLQFDKAMKDAYPLSPMPILRPPEDHGSRIPSNYEYKALPTSSSIRLLMLQPVDLATENLSFTVFRPPIFCSMVTVDLEKSPLYDAVSYTWGDPCTIYMSEDEISPESAWSSRPFDILVDGRPVSVGSNLYNALLTFRYFLSRDQTGTSEIHYTGYFWIDALCINQEDIRERSEQVMMMGRIYKQASKVLAWLGGGDRLSETALVSLRHMSSLPSDDLSFKKMEELDILKETTYKQLGIPNIDRTSWLGIYMLLNRAWFKRSWIIQEANLAQDLIYVCGATQFSYLMLFSSAILLQGTKWINQLALTADPVIQSYRDKQLASPSQSQAMNHMRLFKPHEPFASKLYTIFAFSLGKRLLGKDSYGIPRFSTSYLPLIRLLQRFRSTEATDPRDKVYAFWGMSEEASSQTANGNTSFQVDYSLHPREVFIQTARFLISSSKNLVVLSLKEEYPNTSLPSWVPDFSIQSSMGKLAEFDCFSASLSLGAVSPVFLNHDKLGVSGCRVATTKELSDSSLVLDLPLLAEFLQNMPRSYIVTCPQTIKLSALGQGRDDLSCQEAATPLHEEIQSRFEVLWRTLCIDTLNLTHPAPATCGEAFRLLLITVFEDNIPMLRDATRKKSVDEIFSFEKAKHQIGILYTAMQRILGQDIPVGEVIFPPTFRHFELRLAKCTTNTEIYSVAWDFVDELSDECKNCEHKYPTDGIAHARSLFITEEGHLGLGPAPMQIQDDVWIIAGSKVPFILRHMGGEEYRLIGEAYVHGIMHGQAVTGKSKAEQKEVILI